MRVRILLAAALAIASPAMLRAEENARPADALTISTSASSAYPLVTCTSSDAVAVADTLQLAADTRDGLASLLKLGPNWRFPVHIHVLTPDDPLTVKINRLAAAVFAHGDTMKIEAVVPIGDLQAREFIQRQFVTALLWERFFAGTKAFDQKTKLDAVPVWLVEGLRESLNEDPTHNRESIARHALAQQTAPTLADITGWHEISTDRLLGMWQRAFCFYLVDSLTRQGERRDGFEQWLDGVANASPSAFHFPTEANWQRELAEASGRSRDLVYTWSETADEFAANETITYVEAKNAPVLKCTLDTIVMEPRTPALRQAAEERANVLTELELRAHPSWHEILEAYRASLNALAKETNSEATRRLFAEAHNLRVAEAAQHQKLIDYVNWFAVTKYYADGPTHFSNYFATAREMERVQADPKHPNPIRSNLLQIESEL